MSDKPLDLDELATLCEAHQIADSWYHDEFSRLHIGGNAGEDVELCTTDVDKSTAEKIIKLLEALPRLVKYAQLIKEVTFSGVYDLSDIEP